MLRHLTSKMVGFFYIKRVMEQRELFVNLQRPRMVLSALHNFAAFLLIDSCVVRIFVSQFFAVIAICILKIVHNMKDS